MAKLLRSVTLVQPLPPPYGRAELVSGDNAGIAVSLKLELLDENEGDFKGIPSVRITPLTGSAGSAGRAKEVPYTAVLDIEAVQGPVKEAASIPIRRHPG